jgi:hypothetical protein
MVIQTQGREGSSSGSYPKCKTERNLHGVERKGCDEGVSNVSVV